MLPHEGSDTWKDYGRALVRVVGGLTFFMHGWMKVFQNGIGNVAGFFASLGIPLPEVAAPLVSMLELAGGTMLIIGLLSRWVAIPLAIDMLVAMLLVHIGNGFFAGGGGVELVLLLFSIAVMIALGGGGRPSVDAMLADRTSAAGEPAD